MIFIDRKAVAAPDILALANLAGTKEAENALEFYKDAIKAWAAIAAKAKANTTNFKKRKKRNPPNFEFKVYRDKAVKAALQALFKGKCAYCEFSYMAGITGDVEHYRPKGGVDLEDGQTLWPGYYWLATEWENLLPSCNLCNRPNTLDDLADGKSRTMGKSNFFPVANEKKRKITKKGLVSEEPLLLNPCRDEPSNHLEFFEADGHKALLRGKTENGKRTIEVLGLNRSDLVLKRQTILSDIRVVMKDIQDFTTRLNTAAAADQQWFKDKITEKQKLLETFLEPDREFLAMAAKEIKEFRLSFPK